MTIRHAVHRPTKEDLMIQIAGLVSERSTCQRLKVGAIVTDAEMMTVLAMGYNGSARGQPNTCDSPEPGRCGCVHAEANALIKAPYHQGPLVMFCTHTPCIRCAKLIINSRVSKVYCFSAYRLTEGVELLRKLGIAVYIYYEGEFHDWDETPLEKVIV